MADAFPAPSSMAIGWLLSYLLHSSLLICAVWLVTRFVDLQALTRDFLWKVALVGGLGTATAGVILAPMTGSLRSVGLEELHVGVFHTTLSDGTGSEATWKFQGTESPIRVEARIMEPSPECRAVLRQGLLESAWWPESLRDVCAQRQGVAWFEGALALWLLGGVLGLGMLAFRLRSLRHVAASLGEASPRARKLLDGLLPAAGKLSVPLRGSDMLDAPCVLPGGIVALPRRCEREFSDAELRAVLAHEVAHVARRDVMWSMLMRALVAIFWVQPLNRIALTKLVEAAEFTCDDWALMRTDEPFVLATSIATVAEWMVPGRRYPPVVSIVGRGQAGLAFRVRRILSCTRPRSERVWLRPLAAVLLLAPLCWLPPVPAPATVRASIFVEEVGGVVMETRVIVVRLR